MKARPSAAAPETVSSGQWRVNGENPAHDPIGHTKVRVYLFRIEVSAAKALVPTPKGYAF